MNTKKIIIAARVMSAIFTPFYLPIVGLVALFVFSYLGLLPWAYKLLVLGMVYLFTILVPTLLIHLYHRYKGWTPLQIGVKERRMVPYAVSIFCYFACYYLMTRLRIPSFMARILMAALLIQIVCAIVNVWWKISTHTAAIGGVTGALQAYALLIGFNPTWWLCLVITIAGMVGTSRMLLRQHTLWQVSAGFLLGTAIAFAAILISYLC